MTFLSVRLFLALVQCVKMVKLNELVFRTEASLDPVVLYRVRFVTQNNDTKHRRVTARKRRLVPAVVVLGIGCYKVHE